MLPVDTPGAFAPTMAGISEAPSAPAPVVRTNSRRVVFIALSPPRSTVQTEDRVYRIDRTAFDCIDIDAGRATNDFQTRRIGVSLWY